MTMATIDTPLRIGVALGAGSAAAMAQIGALQALEEAGLPIRYVAGTSAGAIVGAAFAGGRVQELRESLEKLSRRNVMRLFDVAWPSEGLLHGRRALDRIRPHLGDTIEELALPYAAVATDLHSGEEVVLRQGAVFDAVRASIAIPGLFRPWRIGGRLLVDGGLVNPVPVSAALELGAEFVIAINVLPLQADLEEASSLRARLWLVESEEPEEIDATSRTRDERLGLVEVVSQASRILEAQIAGHRLRAHRPGCLLQIPVPATGMFDLHRTGELAEIGRRCAEQALPELRSALERAIPIRRRLRAWQKGAAALLTTS